MYKFFLCFIILTLYPFLLFQNPFFFRWYVHPTRIYINSFCSCYKNGTQPGTRDYQWFSFAFLIVRLYCLFDEVVTPFIAALSLILLASLVHGSFLVISITLQCHQCCIPAVSGSHIQLIAGICSFLCLYVAP